MIVHRPAGRGHAYEIDPDERRPFRPVASETLTVGATSAPSDGPLEIELDWGGSVSRSPAVRRGPARRRADRRFGRTGPAASVGHLTDVTDSDEPSGLVQSGFDVRVPADATLLRYRFVSSGESTEWFEVGVCRWRRDPAAVIVEALAGVDTRFDRDSVEVLADGRACYRIRFALGLEPGERVAGFGERFDSIDQRRRFVDSAVVDQYKSQGARSYLPMPFGIVVGGDFGFHVATGHRCYFDVGVSVPNELRVEVDLEPGVERPELVLDLFAGGPADVLHAFVERTAPELHAPPDWTYRLWLSGNEWNSQARVLHELELARAHDIAVGVLVVEAWSDEQTFVAFNDARYELHEDGSPHRLGDFDFPADGRWPDPKGLVEDLHGRDVKVLLWQVPLVQSDEGQAGCDRRVMAERGYAVRNADGSLYWNPAGWFHDALLLDFTSDDATVWWLEKRRYLIDEIGIDGFKTDGGEHAWGSELVYADGTRGGETNNRYPVLYTSAYQELLRSSGRDPVTFSRSGFTGAGAYPWHWAGDADSTWHAFRASIVAGITAGASGVFFWGWDIAGFSGPLPAPELFLRSAAMAALCPLMQLHSEFNHHRLPSRDRTPWNIAEQTGDQHVVPVFRHFVNLRERLVPYLAGSGRSAVRERKPLMRALFFDHPSDQRIWDFPYQYLLGDDLLVAPVCEEGADRWSVYVPEGDWVDAWNGDECPAGERVVDAPLDRLPVFCRGARAAELVPVFSGLPGVLSSEFMEVR